MSILSSRTRRRGVSLLEGVVSVAIVSVLLVYALNTLGAVGRAQYLQSRKRQGTTLAEAVMAEVMQCRYADPNQTPGFGPELTEIGLTRAAWDDVDDYHGMNMPAQHKNGTSLAGYANWQTAVSVQYVDPANVSVVRTSDSGLKRITVTVSDPTGRKSTLVALRSKSGLSERPPQNSTGYVAMVTVELQAGTKYTATAVGAARPLNQVP